MYTMVAKDFLYRRSKLSFYSGTAKHTFLAVLLYASFGSVNCQSNQQNNLRGVYSWKALEFAFPSERAREAAISRGEFIPGSPLPIDMDVFYGGKRGPMVFLSIPRFQDGVPVTIGYVSNNVTRDGNPIIAPYPDWSWNRLGGCDAITSVYRIQVDACGRLWILDTGKLGDRQVCRPQILAFSLTSNRLLRRYRFPRDHFKDDSIYVTVIVDVRDPEGFCRDTFVYIADVTGFALIVYDMYNNQSWRIHNNLFYPYPQYGTFNIKDDSFDLMDGILGLALSPYKFNQDRILYFHSLASRVESWVPTSVIRNYTMFYDDPDASPRSFQAFDKERSSQSAAQAMDRNGVLFFGLLSDLAIGCWNSRDYSYGGDNIEKIAVNSETLQFPSGLKIITAKNGRQELWVVTVSFQKFMSGSLTPNETNFRIQAAYVDELVRGTKCDVASLGISNVVERPTTGGIRPARYTFYIDHG
ncbi:protein yellow isoform X2 [Cephus cinctus]|uniref:Protein yellow isoform X2 n=1 Tax=Cephus cinctus TaxID=211228 RepID=A0AAJ7BPM0_CEPCN|nr:protein yellow isoform X2 [Cephus cinctus]